MDETFRKEILSCVEKSMQAENFSEMKIDMTGTPKKGEGYLANLIFATVTGTDKNNKENEVHLAIKIGKRSKELRENFSVVVDCYKRELFFYGTVLPAFRQFQLERKIVNIFDAYPKCHATFFSDDIEAVILDDMKIKGFAMHEKQFTMNRQHLHLVLENYAKLHALSYALRDQHKDDFNKLISEYHPVLPKLFQSVLKKQAKELNDHRIQTILREAGRDELAAKYLEEVKTDDLTRLIEVIGNVPKESVIVHGDCHNDNFLFQYKGNDKENPLSVVIIDWQLSQIHSPVLDLSYFLYWAASKESLSQMDEVLKFYHSHLTDFMKQLGSDAQKLFPYRTLVEHWKKYSIFGLIAAKNFIHCLYIPEELAPIPTGNQDIDNQNWIAVKLQNENLYRERLISVMDNYFNFTFT